MLVRTEHFTPQPAGAPLHALPRKFLEPVVYLGDRMTHLGQGLRMGRITLLDLASSAGMADYPQQRWFRELSDHRACDLLDVDTARRGALVLLALLIKSDPESGEAHRMYFTRMRTRMAAEPVTVPVSLEEHKRLALSFFGG